MKHELTGDTWTVRSQDLKADGLRTKFAHREYPENTAPSPSDVDIETVDIDGLTDAEEIALARRYDDVLWRKGNRRGNLRRLQEIRTGALDPADESVSKQWIGTHLGLTAAAAKRALADDFETMGDLAGWVLHATTLTDRDQIGETTAERLRSRRGVFIRWFGGEEYIPRCDDDQQTLSGQPSQ